MENLHNPSFGYVHVPRTAGGSLVNALMQTDWVILGHDVLSEHYMHISDFRRVHPLRKATLITTVRNPYDRLVSAFHYLKEGGDNDRDALDAETYLGKYPDFESFVLKGLNLWNRKRMLRQIHLMPQSYWLSHNHKLLVNEVFRFEELDQLFEYVASHSSIKPNEIGHVHASSRADFEHYYSEKMKRRVQKIYAQDFNLFSYPG